MTPEYSMNKEVKERSGREGGREGGRFIYALSVWTQCLPVAVLCPPAL